MSCARDRKHEKPYEVGNVTEHFKLAERHICHAETRLLLRESRRRIIGY